MYVNIGRCQYVRINFKCAYTVLDAACIFIKILNMFVKSSNLSVSVPAFVILSNLKYC